MFKFTTAFLIVPMLFSISAFAETTGNTWLMLFPNVKLSDEWAVQNDFQFRQSAAFNRTRQYHLRTTVVRDLTSTLQAGAGYYYGEITDYNLALEKPVVENRIHEQIQLKQKLGEVDVGHRLRLEQRFLNTLPSGFSSRLRYRLQGKWPLGTSAGKPYFVASDEAFLQFANGTSPTVNQNRLSGSIGATFEEAHRFRGEIGYMWQSLTRSGAEPLHVHALLVSAIADFDASR